MFLEQLKVLDQHCAYCEPGAFRKFFVERLFGSFTDRGDYDGLVLSGEFGVSFCDLIWREISVISDVVPVGSKTRQMIDLIDTCDERVVKIGGAFDGRGAG